MSSLGGEPPCADGDIRMRGGEPHWTWELRELRGSSPPPGTAGAASEDMAARRKPARPVGICMQHMCKVIKAPYNI